MKMVYKRFLFLLIALLIYFRVSSQISQSPYMCREPWSSISCFSNVVLIDNDMYLNDPTLNSVVLQIEGFADLTSYPNAPIHSIQVPLGNTTYFNYLGSVDLNSNSNVIHGFKLTPLFYQQLLWSLANNQWWTVFSQREELLIKISHAQSTNTGPIIISGSIWFHESLVKNYCANCPQCFSRFQIYSLYSHLFTNNSVFADRIGPFQLFNTISSPMNERVTDILEWFINIPTNKQLSDWEDVLDETLLDLTTTPPAFCTTVIDECVCFKEIYIYYKSIIDLIKNDWNSIPDGELIDHFLNSCDCSAYYCFRIIPYNDNGVDIYHIYLLPIHQANSPAVVIALANNGTSIFGSIGYSFQFSNNCLFPGNPFHGYANCIPSTVVTYNSQTHDFTWGQNFSPFENLLEDVFANCPPPCEDCLPAFSPIPDSSYVITAWVKEDAASITKTSYTYPYINLEFEIDQLPNPVILGPFAPSGPIIEGWQKIESIFTVPSDAIELTLKLESDGGDSYFDDIRIFPAKGSLKTFVYDPVTLRLAAVLDEQHYTTFYEYDEEGKLIRVKKETERGTMTINENRSNIIKKQ